MEKGSHEARMFDSVDKDSGSLQTELMVRVCVCVGMQYYSNAYGLWRQNIEPILWACSWSSFTDWKQFYLWVLSFCTYDWPCWLWLWGWFLSPYYFVVPLSYPLQKSTPSAKIGFSKAMSAGWLRIDKLAEGGPRVFRKVCVWWRVLVCIPGSTFLLLCEGIIYCGWSSGSTIHDLKEGGIPDEQLKDFKKRKLIVNQWVVTFWYNDLLPNKVVIETRSSGGTGVHVHVHVHVPWFCHLVITL